jgi:hypothetical protein
MKNFNSNWDGVDRKNTDDLSEASQQVIDKYRFTPFMEDTNKEGVAGWTISIQGKGVVAYIAEPKIKSGTSPYKIFRTKGLSFKNFFPGELKMSAYPGKENRVVSEKEIRFVPRQLLKAVAMWMDKYGTKALTEDVETTEVVAEAKAPFPKPFKKGETLFAPNKSGKMVKGELVSYETGKVAGGAFTLKLTGQNESGTIVVGAEALFKANPSKMLKKEETAADETQSLDEVQFITPKVPLKGGSNSNSKEKTDYKLYVELKDVVKDAIGILSEAELKIRNPSKNSNLSVLGTIHQANQRLKHAINFGLR